MKTASVISGCCKSSFTPLQGARVIPSNQKTDLMKFEGEVVAELDLLVSAASFRANKMGTLRSLRPLFRIVAIFGLKLARQPGTSVAN
jgi:hypothetical protein